MDDITVILKGRLIEASEALHMAVSLAKEHGANLHVCHLGSGWQELRWRSSNSSAKKSGLQKLERRINSITKELGQKGSQTFFVRGIRPSKITVHGFLIKSDLIVLDGGHRESSFRNSIGKIRVEKMINKLVVPIMTLTRGLQHLEVGTINPQAAGDVCRRRTLDRMANTIRFIKLDSARSI